MKLTVDRIVDAGMATFADVGYERLSMRQVADRLGARAASLYYHVENKDALLRLMADRVAQQAYDAGTRVLDALPASAGWEKRVEVQAAALRRSVLRHPGGADLLAGSPKALSVGALALTERLQRTLADAGVPAEHRTVAADTVLSHATGFVLQEQTASRTPRIGTEEASALAERFPLTFHGATATNQDHDEAQDEGEDAMFARSVQLICRGIATLIDGGHRGR